MVPGTPGLYHLQRLCEEQNPPTNSLDDKQLVLPYATGDTATWMFPALPATVEQDQSDNSPPKEQFNKDKNLGTK